MAENHYDLDYTGSMVDRILDTGYDLQNQGYIFRGLASHYTGTPTERTWLIAPTGSTGFGLSSPVPPGSIGICMYNGSSWYAEILNTLTLDSAPTTGSGNGITSGAVKTLAESITNAIGLLEQSVSDRFTSLTLEDTTGSLQAELLSITLKYVFEGETESLTSISILAATAEKAGLMSATDKQKLDAFITNIRSLRIQDTTAQEDQDTEITNTLKWTIGGVTEAITAFTLYAATTSKAGLMSAADKTALDTLPSLINAGYLYAGIATPSTVPSSTSAKIFYLAIEGGTYTGFNLNVTQGINIIYKSGDAWSAAQVVGIDNEPTAGSDNLVKSGGVKTELALGAVYDVSAHNNGATFESLSALLSDTDLNALIPTAVRKGGMSIKFVQSSDNKYVQFRYMGTDVTGNPNPFLDTANWQGVDDKPTAGSNNLVLSKGIYNDFVSTFLNDNVNIQTLIGKFSLVESSPEITTQDNKFLNENGFVQDITNDAYKVLSVNVSAGEIYKISAYTSPAYNSLFAYYKDTSLIANFVLGLNVTDYYLIIPSGVNILYTQKLGIAGQIKKVTPQIQFTTGEAISTVGIDEKPTPNSSNIPNSGGCYQNMVNAHLDDSYEMASLLGQFDVSYITPTITQTSQCISANGVIKNIESEVYKLLSVDVIPGEIYKITAATSPASQSLYAFYNGENLVANFVLGNIIYDNIVFIPSGVNKLYVQKLDVNGSIQKVVIDSVKIPQSISNDAQYSKNFIESNFAPTEKITNGTIYTNKYILANGTVEDLLNGTYVVEELPVTPYAAYTFYYSGYANKGAYSFMDENGNVLDAETIPTSYVETQVTRVAPNGAAKLNIVHVYNAGDNYRDIIVNGQPYNIKLWKGRKWVVVGDSLTEVNNRTTKHYYDFVKDATGIEVYNMGVSGTGYKRTEENNNAFYQRISNVPLDADVITIFGSFNDNPYFNDIGDITDTGTQTLCGCVNTCLDNLFTVFPLANVGIVSPTPWIEAYPGMGGADRYVQMLENICKHRGIPYYDLYHDSSLRPWEASYRALCYSRDDGNGVHPDEHGHKIIAPRFRAFLESLLI